MKIAQHTKYNKNNISLNITEVSRPTMNENQVLIKVSAAGVNPLDNMISRGEVEMIVPRYYEDLKVLHESLVSLKALETR